ncbi:hypothetical protein O0L34_g17579 [Tuta absoluta]|nr:hypothetical protein O0L34_g17579 [Tuta absoluta]
MNRHLRVPEVTVSGADCDEPEDAPAALPPFALTLASIPRRRHSWICRCVFHTMTGVGLVHVLEVTVSGADCDEPEDAPAALPPFALTLASIPRRRHSWICRSVRVSYYDRGWVGARAGGDRQRGGL